MDPENQNFQKNGQNTLSYYHFTNINDSHMIYGSSDMECNGQNFLSFWNIFCPFIPPNNLKNQNLKNKKTPRDIILHMCTINDNHMIYGSSDIEHDRQNFLSPPHPNNPKKTKFQKKIEKCLEILSFYTCVP